MAEAATKQYRARKGWLRLGVFMGGFRTGIAAFVLAFSALVPTGLPAAETAKAECGYTLIQYHEAIAMLDAAAAKARALAEINPLYESDVQYFAAVLADAQQCAKTVAPITAASR
jgi:hypothetical protein